MERVRALGGMLLAVVLLGGGAAAPAAELAANGRLAYVRTDGPQPGIWVVAPDGSSHAFLVQGSDPAWSPDGSRLAYVREGAIYVGGAQAQDERLLTQGRFPSWSPDGRSIAFSRVSTAAPDQDLYVIGVDGAGLRPLTSGTPIDQSPAWSPDGSRIVFVRDGALRTVAAAGGEPKPLRGADQGDESPRWSPDGTRIAFARGGAVYVAGDGGGASADRVSPTALWSTSPAWSPDGNRIAFQAGGSVCTAHVDGSDARRVTFDSVTVTYTVGAPPLSWQPAASPAGGDSPYSCSDPRWDIALSIRANRPRAAVGQFVTYTVTERNLGPDPATQTNVGIALPADSQRVVTSFARGDCNQEPGGSFVNFLSCSPGVLFPGEESVVRISVRLLAPGPLRAQAVMPVYGDPHDINGSNDQALTTVVVVGCSITGTNGADVLVGTVRRDVICGLDGNDVIRGLGGNDATWAGAGNDIVFGGAGNDKLLGGSGNDRLDAGSGNDVAWGGSGSDILLGGDGADALHGGETGGRLAGSPPYSNERDALDGGRGPDVLDGGVGTDQLAARAGDDTVLAADGQRDAVDCGAGRDLLVADVRDAARGCERISRT